MTAEVTAGLEPEPARTSSTLAPGQRPASVLRIAFFGYDRTDTTVLKRTLAFHAVGASITGFMFRRARGMEAPELPYPVIDLGTTVDRNYLRRLPALGRGLVRIVRNRHLLRRCGVIYARNLDMLALAVAARALGGPRAAIVYEVLDVRPILRGTGTVSRAMRAIERWLMRRASLLVVSSPAYITQYFEPHHHHRGPHVVLENKLDAARVQALGALRTAPEPGQPWNVGWFGVLKCRRSLDLLTRLAARLGDRVRIIMRGIPSETDVPRALIEDTCRRHPNMVFGGPYASPRDLPRIYGEVHLTWAADFLDPTGNSAWCLPNRLYEGGNFGIPALALAGTATGDMIERTGLGWTIDEPLEDTVPSFLDGLTPAAYREMCHDLQSKDRSIFIDFTDTADLIHRMEVLAKPGTDATQAASTARPEQPA